MDELWNYFEPVKDDPFYLTCTVCQSKFKGWKRSMLKQHLVAKHQLKVPPNLDNKSAMPNIIEIEDTLLYFRRSSINQCQSKFNREKMEKVIFTRSNKIRLTFNKIQVNMIERLPHIGAKIFDSLDNESLLKCKEVSRTWYDFINDQKFPWVRMIKVYVKESNKMYTECPKHWRRLFRKNNVKQVKTFAREIQKYIAMIIEYDCSSLSHVDKGLTPLHFASMFCHEIDMDIIQRILETEVIKNPRDKDGNTPLHIAADKGHLKVFQLIKEMVDDINPKNDHGNTPLHMVALNDEMINVEGKQIIELILKNIIDKNPSNRFGTTPLHNAATNGKFDIFQLIYENALNKNPIDIFGDTPLHKAAKDCQSYLMKRMCHHDKICQMISDNVENKSLKNFDGKTPLQVATDSNHWLVLDFLTPKDTKKRRANLNLTSSKAKQLKDQ